jgi:hypothetical protein
MWSCTSTPTYISNAWCLITLQLFFPVSFIIFPLTMQPGSSESLMHSVGHNLSHNELMISPYGSISSHHTHLENHRSVGVCKVKWGQYAPTHEFRN